MSVVSVAGAADVEGAAGADVAAAADALPDGAASREALDGTGAPVCAHAAMHKHAAIAAAHARFECARIVFIEWPATLTVPVREAGSSAGSAA